MSSTRKNRVRGWAKSKPGYHQKTVMYKRCGKKCFLGPNKSFPICSKNTCKIKLPLILYDSEYPIGFPLIKFPLYRSLPLSQKSSQ